MNIRQDQCLEGWNACWVLQREELTMIKQPNEVL